MELSICSYTKLLIACIFLALLPGCTSYKYSYTEENLPEYFYNYDIESKAADKNTLKVASFNIEFSLRIDEAIELLSSDADTDDIDILMLQEMDEIATAQIAKALHMSYIYYPAIYHPKYKKNVGTAILSRFPITQKSKIILPHPSSYPKVAKWKNYKFNKIATHATIEIRGKVIALYSLHTAAFNTTQKKWDCSTKIAHHAKKHKYSYIIVGGDFNSMGQTDIQASIDPFLQENYIWSSRDIGHSGNHKRALLAFIPAEAFVLDHIVSKGFKLIDSGKLSAVDISDHDLIWTELEIK